MNVTLNYYILYDEIRHFVTQFRVSYLTHMWCEDQNTLKQIRFRWMCR